MVQLARNTLKDVPAIIASLGIGNSIGDLKAALLDVGHRTLEERQLQRVAYQGVLMKNGTFEAMVRGVNKIGDKNGVQLADTQLAPVVFDSYVEGLGAALSKARDQKADTELDHIDSIASHVGGIDSEVVWNASRGRCIAAPES